VNWVFASLLLYLAAQLAIGMYVSRRVRTESDFLLAGRQLGYSLAIFSIFATWFGAETCIGAAGAIYEHGLSGGSSDPFGYSICLFLMGALFAIPLYRLKLTTIVDLFRQRYSPGVERLAVALMVPGSLLWAAAQVRAFGQVLTTASPLELELAIGIAAAVVIAYTTFGGMLADAVTDLIQGVVLAAGLVVVLVATISASGGLGRALDSIEPARLSPFGGPEASLVEILDAWAVPICGSVIAQELVSRVLASRTERIARRSTLIAGTVYLTFGLIPVLVGLLGPKLIPNLADPERILPMVAQQHLPTVLYALFAGAMVSAILSTVNSTLLVASSLVSHNLIPSMRPNLDDRSKTRLARIGVVVSGVIAYVIALQAEGIYALVKEASAFGSAGLFVIVVTGLFLRVGRAASAYAALVTGLVVWVLGSYVPALAFPGVYVASLAASVVAYFAFAPLGASTPLPELETHAEPQPEPEP
jgi:SSS family transporter